MSNDNGSGNSVKQGMGIGIGLILIFSFLGMLPICGCGGCLFVGFLAEPAFKAAAARERAKEIEAKQVKIKREAKAK